METRIYPGILCNSIEFFNHQDGIKIFQSGKVLDFTELPFSTIQLLEEEIEKNKDVKMELQKLHPNSKYKKLEQFVKCRFGGLDFQPDIKDGQLQDGEYWDCPNRGKCASEGILCKLPSYNKERLTMKEIEIIQQITTDKKNETIAEDLEIPTGTFHKMKKILYKKLDIQTKQQVTGIAYFLNLIQF